MIKKLVLKNIQSHRETALEFDPGINTIIGSSNAGKTAILRALYWLKYNRPLGIDTLASHWALTDKGNLKDEMSVEFENDNGTVIRRRTSKENQYIINEKIFNVVKSDVPAEVESAVSLTDTNIQKQLDEPFLLSETSGNVARYFNNIVRLDIIDRVLGNAEATRRRLKQEIEAVENAIKDYEEKLKHYEFLPITEKLLNKHRRVEAMKDAVAAEIAELNEGISEYGNAAEAAGKSFDLHKMFISRIEQAINERREAAEIVADLKKSICDFEAVRTYPDFSPYKILADKLINYAPDTAEIGNLRLEIGRLVDNLGKSKKAADEAVAFKKQLPEICPLCGGVMKMEGD